MDFVAPMKTTTKSSRIAALACAITIAFALTPAPVWAKTHKVLAQPTDSNYIAGLGIANRFLAAWQSNDQAAAMPLVTTRAKERSTEEGVDQLFSGSSDRAFEITRGHLLRQGRYQFSIVLLQADDSSHTRRRFAELIITKTGKNDWAVDKLP
jgi:hypothetical protein